MKKIVISSICVLVCLVVGFTASFFQTEAITHWYPTLSKSALTPPNLAFPIAWTALYILMGISISLIIMSSHYLKKALIILFVLQLIVNFLWSIFFFYLQNPFLGLIDIVILDIMVIFYIIKSYSVSKISTWLLIPYLLWILFATYLNTYIYINN